MMNKIIIKVSLIVFFILSVVFSVKAQDIVEEEVEAGTTVGDTIRYDGAIYKPSLADLAMDSLMNLSNRIVLPDSIIDKESLDILISPILLKKVRLADNVLVSDASKAEFTSLGLPEIVYDYFLQQIGDYNFYNRVYGKSFEQIKKEFKNLQDEARLNLSKIELVKKKRDLINSNIMLIKHFSEIKKLNSKEIQAFYSIHDLLSDKLEIVDGKLTADISENKELDSNSLQYIQLLLDLTNLKYEINGFSLQDREKDKENLKIGIKMLQYFLLKYQNE